MAQLTWTKLYIEGADFGYAATGDYGMYETFRQSNGKFQFYMDKDQVGSPGTLAACKEAAQAHEDERDERSRKAQAEAQHAYDLGLLHAPATPHTEVVQHVARMAKEVATLGTWTCRFCSQSFAAPLSPRPLCPYCKHDRGLTFAVGMPTLPVAPAKPVPVTTPRPTPNVSINDSGRMASVPPASKPVANPATGLAAALAKPNVAAKGMPRHVMVRARAGTGKTTTIIEGLKDMRCEPTRIVPSVQQRRIWDELELSRDARSVALAAFSSTIGAELKQRAPSWCDVKTMHGFGYKAIRKQFTLLDGDAALNKYRVGNIIAELLGCEPRDVRKHYTVAANAIEDLVALCKVNLIGLDWIGQEGYEEEWADAIEGLARHYEVDMDELKEADHILVMDMVPRVLERCMDVAKDKCIDFNDQIWLPIVLDLPMFKYDLLLVDEVQDLNKCQQELAFRLGRRLVMVGDDKQAVFGFAGADAKSYANLEARAKADPRGCVLLPLTVTRRCGHAIVKEANAIVADFQAHESNGPGKISHARFPGKKKSGNYWMGTTEVTWDKSYAVDCRPGDMLLCRVNAPLVSQCFAFLKRSIKAVILGRDIGKNLTTLIVKMKARNVPELITRLGDWLHKETEAENASRHPSESKLIAMQDKVDCIMCFTEDSPTVEDVVRRIEAIFTDNRDVPGIRLSSIHKAKGLEAERVFLLEPEGATVPHPMAKSPWQHEQEMNLRYVAITRAIKELIFVS